MATYQLVLNNTWDDPVFQAWDADTKLLFLNLVTSHRNNPLGLYAVTKKTLMFETGLSEARFQTAWEAVTSNTEHYSRVRFDEGLGVVWIVNTLKHQRGIVPKNVLIATHVQKLLLQYHQCALVPDLIGYYRARGYGWLFGEEKSRADKGGVPEQAHGSEVGGPPPKEFKAMVKKLGGTPA